MTTVSSPPVTDSGIRAFFLRTRWRGKSYLLSPFLDALMVGGGAVVALLFVICLVPVKNEADYTHAVRIAFWAAFLVNNPHFMASYQLFYRDYRAKLSGFAPHREMWWRCAVAGVIAPAGLACLLGYAAYDGMVYHRYQWISYALSLMIFLVGWHYMKQAFGVFVVLCALQSVHYSPRQRLLLLGNSYVAWLFGWSMVHYFVPPTSAGQLSGSIPSATIVLPYWIEYALLAAAMASGIAVLVMLVRAWREEGKRPPVTALLGYTSMYTLFALVTIHPAWVILAPFFHSLQYLLFVAAYKRGQCRKEAHLPEDGGKAPGRLRSFFVFSFIIGILAFFTFPSLADRIARHWTTGSVPLFMTIIPIFINIHHYFLDNVIWRRENGEVGEYLFKWSR